MSTDTISVPRVELVAGQRYVYANAQGHVAVGTFVKVLRTGRLKFTDVAYLFMEEPFTDRVYAAELLDIEPWRQSVRLAPSCELLAASPNSFAAKAVRVAGKAVNHAR